MRPGALVYLYRRRLRAHAVQELLAGLGVAIAAALICAVVGANASVTSSTREVVQEVVGPATLQLRARGNEGFDARTLVSVTHLPGVKQAAPLLEQPATIVAPNGRRIAVDLAGADVSLTVLDGRRPCTHAADRGSSRERVGAEPGERTGARRPAPDRDSRWRRPGGLAARTRSRVHAAREHGAGT
jgi:hypothetical protein